MRKCLEGNPILASIQGAVHRVPKKLRACDGRQRAFRICIEGVDRAACVQLVDAVEDPVRRIESDPAGGGTAVLLTRYDDQGAVREGENRERAAVVGGVQDGAEGVGGGEPEE